MARQVRLEFAGAVYHIVARGNRDEAIVRDGEDRAVFLRTLGEACGRSGFRVHGFVLLDNHYHLLLETPLPNLSQGMSWLQNAFTRRFNARHRLRGHLFGGRYRSVVVEPGAYFRALLDYIHLNPVRSGIVRNAAGLEAYAWSSLKFYLSGEGSRPAWLETRTGFLLAGAEDTDKGRGDFLAALAGRVDWSCPVKAGVAWPRGHGFPKVAGSPNLRRGWFFGAPDFRDKLMALAADPDRGGTGTQLADHKIEVARHHGEKHAAALLKAGLRYFEVAQDELKRARKNDPRKALLAELIHAKTSVRLDWISGELGMGTRSGCCRLIYQMRERLKSDREFKRHRKKVRKAV